MTLDTKTPGVMAVEYMLGHAGFISSAVGPTLGGPPVVTRRFVTGIRAIVQYTWSGT